MRVRANWDLALGWLGMALLWNAAGPPAICHAEEAWQPAPGPLMTRWAAEVSPDQVHPEYPRPQLVRTEWRNLNGLWDYAIRPRDERTPEDYDGKILVPFPVESALSGVGKPFGPERRLWYRRRFEVPADWRGRRVLLHFGAVDWQASVWVNGKQVGQHEGGYDPFSLDVTDALRAEGPQEITVAVWDPVDAGYQPRGKQVREPRGIWYTSVTGIWQTVWLEPVATRSIRALQVTTDIDRGTISVRADIRGDHRPGNAAPRGKNPAGKSGDDKPPANRPLRLRVTVREGSRTVASGSGPASEPVTLSISAPKLWSPAHPHLYDLEVELLAEDPTDAPLDRVGSYCGMRKITVGPDRDGLQRLLLNNQPLFQYGTLDQGWWPDGLYTAPTDEALRYDLEVTRKLGFNMCRKHVKVEPARWYYHCDRLGLLVWQDMPNGDRHIGADEPDITRSAESERAYRREWTAIIDALRNHPSIVVWVPFNEGWGQFKTDEILRWTGQYDPSRLVDGPSGWADRGSGDMHDMHRYPGPAMPEPEADRAVVLGEFGGLGWPVEGHLWWDKRNWGYRTYDSQGELQQNYEMLIARLRPLIRRGLAAAIYTQTTDVEGEVNGLMTYDRAVVKLPAERLARLHAKLYEPMGPIRIVPLLATSRQEPRTWRYTTERPSDDWMAVEHDDSAWKEGQGGFGDPSTPGSVVRTSWKTEDIWLRQTFTLDKLQGRPALRIHHDEDAEVYLNGRKIASLSGYQVEYIDVELDEEVAGALKKGRNTLAIHCRQTGGGQYIDAGLIGVVELPSR